MDYYCIDGYEPKVEKAILNLFKNQLFTDVTVKFKPGDTQFRVHKLILALYSPVLCDIFNEKSGCKNFTIEGNELSAVENMINFCYGEPPVFRNIFEIKETNAIAENYKIVELSNICIKEINTVKVDASNVLTVLEMSVQYGNTKKENECLEFIRCNRKTVFASELFMEMKFEAVSEIFEKLRERGFLTEVQYLRSAIEWMKPGDNKNKEKLMKRIEITKLGMDELVDIIISFPNFFTSSEIADAFKKIKDMVEGTSPKEQTNTLAESEITVEVTVGADELTNIQTREISNQKCTLTVSILDGNEDAKQAILTIEDEKCRRGLNICITEDLKDGIFLQLLSHGNGDYAFKNVNLTYDGVYFLFKYLKCGKEVLSPLNFIEVLKAAFYFGLQKVRDSCLEELNNVIDFDPAFLDALVLYSIFIKKVKNIIISNTMDIVLHPNFVDCSANLIMLILIQEKLSLPSELQLLIVTIQWLEARNRFHWYLRPSLLKGIAFENVNHTDFKYVLMRYPLFFTNDEIDSILLYKESNNSDNRKSLPKWYSFKQREYCREDTC